MPRFDGTGPQGLGAMTGHGAGFCAGYERNGYGLGFRYGQGRGGFRGAGRGFGYGYARGYATPALSPEQVRNNEVEFLKRQSAFLENELTSINGRLSELENGNSGE